MDGGAVIWMTLSILSTALIAGGIVAYRGSQSTGARSFGAAAIAAGIVMWAIVLVTLPVSHTQQESPEPTLHYQERVLNEE